MNIRSVTFQDARQICDIYNYYVENTCITFETVPLTEEEMKTRIQEITGSGNLYFIAEVSGHIVGYCYVSRWHPRSAYHTTKEITVYLDPNQYGKGYGTKLYEYLLQKINRNDTHVLIACLFLPNKASVCLHEKFGFRQVSHMKEIGTKFNKWLEIGHWQLIL